MRHGWLRIKNVQDGDRTVAEQVEALKPAIAECAGKTLLDLGAAECLISREFIRAGAKHATCLEAVPGHLAVASEQCKGLPMEFVLCDLNVATAQLVYSVDIVLCLGIAHKLLDPAIAIRFSADCSRDLVLIRSGRGADSNGIIRSKHRKAICDSHAIMMIRDFVLEKTVMGPPPHSESVEYWRKMWTKDEAAKAFGVVSIPLISGLHKSA